MTEILELTEDMTGRYLVKTQGSIHLWDLDNKFYVRNPSPESMANRHMPDHVNHRPLSWVKVERWPKVGQSFLTILNGDMPWHRSSTIRSIERLDDDTD